MDNKMSIFWLIQRHCILKFWKLEARIFTLPKFIDSIEILANSCFKIFSFNSLDQIVLNFPSFYWRSLITTLSDMQERGRGKKIYWQHALRERDLFRWRRDVLEIFGKFRKATKIWKFIYTLLSYGTNPFRCILIVGFQYLEHSLWLLNFAFKHKNILLDL